MVITLSYRVPGQGIHHAASVYVGDGSLDKGANTIQPAVQEAIAWAQAKTGLHTVLFISDRASQEFSNVTNLMFLTLLPTLFAGLLFLWAFDTPGHGKGVCDGIGAAIKFMIENWMQTLGRLPSVDEIIQFLWNHTKNKPIRAPKYAKFKEYRFKELKVRDSETAPLSGTTIPNTKKFYLWRAGGKEGHLVRRHLPCFCSYCLAQACKATEGCANSPVCGGWEDITIKPPSQPRAKSSQSSQQ